MLHTTQYIHCYQTRKEYGLMKALSITGNSEMLTSRSNGKVCDRMLGCGAPSLTVWARIYQLST